MSDKDRQKKDGQNKNKKIQARHHNKELAEKGAAATTKANVAQPKTFAEDKAAGESGSTSGSRTARAKAAKADKGK